MFNKIKVNENKDGSVEVSFQHKVVTTFIINGADVKTSIIDSDTGKDWNDADYKDIISDAAKFLSSWLTKIEQEKQKGNKKLELLKEFNLYKTTTEGSPVHESKSKAYKVLRALDYTADNSTSDIFIIEWK